MAKVWRVGWWMAHYSSSTPKRHFAYSNSAYIRRLDKGVLQWKRRVGHKGPKTAVTYKSKSTGKVCYKGTSALKKTETLGLFFWCKHVLFYTRKGGTIYTSNVEKGSPLLPGSSALLWIPFQHQNIGEMIGYALWRTSIIDKRNAPIEDPYQRLYAE